MHKKNRVIEIMQTVVSLYSNIFSACRAIWHTFHGELITVRTVNMYLM